MDHRRTTDGAQVVPFPPAGQMKSRCDDLHPVTARIVLLLLLGVTLFLVRASRTTHVAGQVAKTAFTDSDMHTLVIERLRRGEGYYDALGVELRRNGYGVRPIFHWRTPAFLWVIAQMRSSYVARAVLMVLTILGVKLWIHELHLRGGLRPMILGGVFFIPLFALALDSKWVLEPEPWVAALLLLSLAVYARRPAASIACGLGALMLRELALLYVLVMLAFALRERRYREALAWSLGILAFFIYFGIHAWLVWKHTLPDDPLRSQWFGFGGPAQVVTCSSYLLLGQGPHWFLAILTVLAVAGLANREELNRPLIVVVAYMAAIALGSAPYDWYWGIIYLPLLAIGLGHSFAAVAGLVRAALALAPPASQAGGQE